MVREGAAGHQPWVEIEGGSHSTSKNFHFPSGKLSEDWKKGLSKPHRSRLCEKVRFRVAFTAPRHRPRRKELTSRRATSPEECRSPAAGRQTHPRIRRQPYAPAEKLPRAKMPHPAAPDNGDGPSSSGRGWAKPNIPHTKGSSKCLLHI